VSTLPRKYDIAVGILANIIEAIERLVNLANVFLGNADA
jgi:hypothetical protein